MNRIIMRRRKEEDNNTITWEGSLNILSQGISREIMKIIDSKELMMQMLNSLKLEKFL